MNGCATGYRPQRSPPYGISINLTHAKVARDKKPAPPSLPPIGRFIKDYMEIVDLCRAQADRIGICRHEIDRLGGLPDGHSGHVLTRSMSKIIGPLHLIDLLETLGLRLLIIEDPALLARTRSRRTPRDERHVRRTTLLPAPYAAR